jgi:hypothetical protein
MKNKLSFIQTEFVNVVLCFLILIATNSHAETSSARNLSLKKPASIDYYKLRTAQTATMILVPWSDLSWVKPLPKWDETTFNQFGCVYTTQNQAHIGSLVRILLRATFSKASAEDAPFQKMQSSVIGFEHVIGDGLMIGTRLIVYLTFTDGTKAKFFIDSDNGYIPNNGKNTATVFTFPPKNNIYPMYGDPNLPWNLAFWASQLGKPTGQDVDTVRKCERYINTEINWQY